MLPLDQWHQLFDVQAAARPDTVHMQLHVVIVHALPADPAAAFIRVSQLAHNVEARLAGSGLIGDNLAARLDAARADAIYARVLFLFLGLPGVVPAILLTLAVITAGSVQRRRDQAFLRVHGAATNNLMWLAAMEAGLVAVGGTILGIGLAWLLSTPNWVRFVSSVVVGDAQCGHVIPFSVTQFRADRIPEKMENIVTALRSDGTC